MKRFATILQFFPRHESDEHTDDTDISLCPARKLKQRTFHRANELEHMLLVFPFLLIGTRLNRLCKRKTFVRN